MKRILVVTNDSAVFLVDRIGSAFEMFGGRMTEVKRLVARLAAAEDDGRKACDVSFGVISSRFGFVPGNYVLMRYDGVMSCKEDYERVQAEKDYLGQLNAVSVLFDLIVVCVPKDMFAMVIDGDVLPQGKVVAITAPELESKCKERGWTFLERRGARVGNENADKVFEIIRAVGRDASS
ncbi:MAG: hypothetical protein LBS92_05770 [Candidatus Methanoplasma sp.]|nr:hypothetical protein [Candidatus Methanoplasma sp.]